MEHEYDVIVIGTGVAGSDVALHCREAGLQVAITDHRPYGGTCALRGCVPKWVLAGAAEAVSRIHNQQGAGIRGTVSIDWPELIAFERSFTDPVSQWKEESFREAGIHTYQGFARFAGPNQVSIGDDLVAARHIVIATGAVPRPLGVPGADLVTSSDDFFYLEALPERIVFIGGGYISFEFAHVAARAGAKAVILQRSGQVLKGFDHDIVARLVQASQDIGIDIQVNMPLVSVEKVDSELRIHAGKKGDETVFEADMAIHGAGRVPAIEGLGLEAGKVETDRRGIRVNEHLQSISNPAVYVAGDANPRGVPLTPVAVMDAHIVTDNILRGNTRIADYSVVPSAVFTTPPLAAVGLTEEAAKKKGVSYMIHSGDLSERFTNRATNLRPVAYKILIDSDSRKILGAHLIGRHVEEVVNVFALAIKHELTVDDLTLDAVPWAYPSNVYDIIYMGLPDGEDVEPA